MADFPPAGRPLGGIMGIPILPRIFITANPVLQTHYLMQTAKTYLGDFDLSALAVLPASATTVTLFGQVSSAANYIKVLSTGFASIGIGGSVVTSTVAATKDNKYRRYGVKLLGDDFVFTEGGVTIDTVTDATAAAKSLVIDALSISDSLDFFSGVLADPVLIDRINPNNSESWQLNLEFPATTEQSSSGNNILTYNNAPDSIRGLFTFNQSDNQWVGVERVVNGGFDNGLTGWSGVFSSGDGSSVTSLDGITTILSNGDYVAVTQTILEEDDFYKFTIDITTNRGGTLALGNVVGGQIAIGTVGITKFDFQTTATLMEVKRSQICDIDVNSVSIKRFIEVA